MREFQVRQLADYSERIKSLNAKWKPHAKQEEVLKAIFTEGYRKVFIRAGRRSGKTQTSLYISNRIAGLFPNKRCSIITPSLKQGKKIYWKHGDLTQFAPKSWISKISNEDTTVYFKNGSFIELDGSENIEAHRGVANDLVILDEYKDIDERFLWEVILPTFATTDGIVIVVGTPPEVMEGHHFYETEQAALKDPSWKVIEWEAHDSPYIPKQWLVEEEARYAAKGDLDIFIREYRGKYVRGGKKMILPTFNRMYHVRRRDSITNVLRTADGCWDELEWYVIADPATSAAFGVLLIGFDRLLGRVFVIDEFYLTDKADTAVRGTYKKIKDMIKRHGIRLSEVRFVHDDAASWLPAEVLAQANLHTFPAGKASADKDTGISLWKDLMLADGSFYIAEECTFFITEIENYIMVNGKYPTKKDHLLDCFRYFLSYAKVVVSVNGNSLIDSEVGDDYSQYDDLDDLPPWYQ